MNLLITIRNILILKANINTPIIFLYDGHGYTGTNDKNGNLIIRHNLDINIFHLKDIFSNYESNNKLFLFTQCGSYDFTIKFFELLNKNDNSILFSSVDECNKEANGFKVSREFTDVLKSADGKTTFKSLKDHSEHSLKFDKRIHVKNNTIKVEDIYVGKKS